MILRAAIFCLLILAFEAGPVIKNNVDANPSNLNNKINADVPNGNFQQGNAAVNTGQHAINLDQQGGGNIPVNKEVQQVPNAGAPQQNVDVRQQGQPPSIPNDVGQADQAANQQHAKKSEEIDASSVIAKHPACINDVKRICNDKQKDGGSREEKKIQLNFDVLDCFMSYEGDEEPPSAECQSVLYQYKMKLTQDGRFENAAKEVCKDFIDKQNVNTHCGNVGQTGAFLPCLMELASYVEDDAAFGQNCFNFLNKMQRVIFSDYHLVHDFQKDCGSDIVKLNCGFIFDDKAQSESVQHHNQGRVIECLIKKDMSALTKDCKHQILRVSELQADDYHLDRPLFFACRADREKHCKVVHSGNGKVYKCLMEKQQEGVLDSKCVEQLIKREQLMEADAKVDRTFYQACRSLLTETGCKPAAHTTDLDAIKSMSDTLICLMDAEAESDKEYDVSEACQNEIELFQGNLMNEYKITAGIVSHCQKEIDEHCLGMKKAHEKDGTIHCLMDLAMPTRHEDNKPSISNKCKAEVTSLLEETRPGGSSLLAIDGYLMEQCHEEINQHCRGNKQPLDCLMDEIRKGKMPHKSECARHLLELEYFISRNYKHDMKLVKACHRTIKNYNLDRHLAKNEQGPPSDGLVFAQLYSLVRRQFKGDNLEHAVDKKCVTEILRCVHERAVSIDLNPELEEACLNTLTTMCKEAEHGEELACLEEHVDEIPESKDPNVPGCREMVEDYIMDQDSDYQLDTILMQACEPTIQKHCRDVLDGVEEGDIDQGEVFECLLEHKFDKDIDHKCFIGIEHHQIINMQDFKFSHKFREACNHDFQAFCKGVKSKSEAVYCLSTVIRNDTLLDAKQRVSKACRAQLKVEFLALEDTIQIDPGFKSKCDVDMKKHCSRVKNKGRDEDSTDLYLNCIRSVDPEQLQPQCAKYVFKVVKLQNALAGVSSTIFRQCKIEIKQYCANHMDDPDQLLDCLDENYEQASKACKRALDEEEEEDNQDIRLNPALYNPCKTDIDEFCHKELNKGHDDDESLHGAVIGCLKLEYLKGERSGLSKSCSNQMHLLVVKVQTRDYKMDYKLTHECKKEIVQCSKSGEGEHHIVECLKKKLFEGKLKQDIACQAEVFRLVTENRVDIQTDGELYQECKREIDQSECKNVLAGSGRVMSCLLMVFAKGQIKNKKCRELVKQRKELWEHAAQMAPPETLREIWEDMSTSESRWYFMTVIGAVLAVILFIGICCGRASKRVAAEIKNRYSGKQRSIYEMLDEYT
ncbi:Golgi apparatus protein 1-like isoform X2 [Watersipora subatra]|uniref:Golgi apparatus protein 1-like isoform X2 n=1 Tax=Watersipora subatra TaxID=2589382 RepID=UPI00355AE413